MGRQLWKTCWISFRKNLRMRRSSVLKDAYVSDDQRAILIKNVSADQKSSLINLRPESNVVASLLSLSLSLSLSHSLSFCVCVCVCVCVWSVWEWLSSRVTQTQVYALLQLLVNVDLCLSDFQSRSPTHKPNNQSLILSECWFDLKKTQEGGRVGGADLPRMGWLPLVGPLE